MYYPILIIFVLFQLNSPAFGEGIIDQIRDVILTSEQILSDTFSKLLTQAQNMENIKDIVTAAIEENCTFKCSNGNKPIPNKYHKPKSNGCGVAQFKIKNEYLPVPAMTGCCDVHDICYSTCGSEKEKCDKDFKDCLYKYCKHLDNSFGDLGVSKCKLGAKVLYTTVIAAACKFYQDAQKQACYCPSLKENFKTEL